MVSESAAHRQVADRYLQKRQLYPFQITSPVGPDLNMVVVIPCLAEPDLLLTLESLAQCRSPRCALEVLVVVNHAADAPQAVSERNRQTLHEAANWARQRQPNWSLHVLHHPDLPARRAGVGLARKLGLDEALARLARSDSGEGLLVFLDADCTVSDNYLRSIEDYYLANPSVGAATVAFEHPLTGAGDGLAIAQYELHLRYYVAALRYAGLPNVLHTVGSCLTCRSPVYAGQGGMNRRQAGEDYYFVQKLVAAVTVGEINRTRVFPSPRSSWRVPFGTGRAIASNTALAQLTYAPQIFSDLAAWVALVPELYEIRDSAWLEELPESISGWLQRNAVVDRLAEVRRNTASQDAFNARLFRWFNAFRSLKFVHDATDRHYPLVAVEAAAENLLQRLEIGCEPGARAPAFDLLRRYRQLQNGA